MSKIYDLPISFRLVKVYVRFTYRQFYNQFVVIGKENIPKHGPIIFAPNHLNALMDPLAVYSVSSDRYATIFLGRADIFRKKLIAKFLKSCKILPAFRIRDGFENLGRNTETINQCIEVLVHKNALGIMPEGNQELERKIRPLVKGIFRIAFAAQQKLADSSSLKIVPIGIEYDDFIKFGQNIIINIGKPIDVKEYMELYDQNNATGINKMKSRLKYELENLTVNLDTNDFYSCFETTVYTACETMLHKMNWEDNIVNRFAARREIGKILVETEKKSIEKIKKLQDITEKLKTNLDDLKLNSRNFQKKPLKLHLQILKGLFLLITLPIFIIGLLLNFLPFFSPKLIRKVMNVKYIGFYSSVHYGASIITFPLFYILQSIVFFSIFNFNWLAGLLFIPFQYFSGKFAYWCWYRKFGELMLDIRLKRIKKQQPEKYNELMKLTEEITGFILE